MFSTNGDLTLNFKSFDMSLGTLDGVTMDLDSSITYEESGGTFTTTVKVDSQTVATESQIGVGSKQFDFSDFDLLALIGDASFFEGDGITTFDVLLEANATVFTGTWIGNDDFRLGQNGLTVTYTYTANIPLPAGLPLLAAGIGAFGWAGYRRRKNAVSASFGKAEKRVEF